MDTQQSGRVSLVQVAHWVATLTGPRAGATFAVAAELAFKQFVDGPDEELYLHENNFRALCGYFAVFAAAVDGFDVLLGSRTIVKVQPATDANTEQTMEDPAESEIKEATASNQTGVIMGEGKTKDTEADGEVRVETNEHGNLDVVEHDANDIESPTSIHAEVSGVDDPQENAASKIQARIRGRQAREFAAGQTAAKRNRISKQQWMDGLRLLTAHPLPSLSACSRDESMATTAFTTMCADAAIDVSVEDFLLWVKTQEIETGSAIGSLLLLSV